MADETVRSPIGDVAIDSAGSAVGVARMNPQESYADVPELLRQVIDEGNAEAWQAIKKRIDYTLEGVDAALAPLQAETAFGDKVRAEAAKGKKLLFKPNLVVPICVDPQTHAAGLANFACTAWPLVAALMRWFHDKLDISYHQMAIGEAATALSACAGRHSRMSNGRVTTEAVIEGRAGDFYGGWAFYFVRKYLAETHDPSHGDDPMRGYEDSVAGNYVPPGKAMDRLPVYDLNRIQDLRSKGRIVPVPDGVNFKEITLHKAIVGGDPNDTEDMRDYPGCMLINVPKLKVHAIALFTNAIKNLGIGLYPMEAAGDSDAESTRWLYSSPRLPMPGMKSRIPHEIWVADCDDLTGLPKHETVQRTGGLAGTMVDIVKAVLGQGITIFSVVDAIEAGNIDHTMSTIGVKVPEGYVFASSDTLALDVACARYMFKMVPMAEARALLQRGEAPSEFLQRVPLPTVEGPNIVSTEGVDSPISRDDVFPHAEKRGLGSSTYHVVGRDAWEGGRLASVQGHLGKVSDGAFSELMTTTLYFDNMKALWDLQASLMAYAAANDQLTGSNFRREILDAFDENRDGILGYEEMGKKSAVDFYLFSGAHMVHLMGSEQYGMLRGAFQNSANTVRWSDSALNEQGHDFLKETLHSYAALVGYFVSQLEMEGADPFFPSMTWGKGKWPSFQFARYLAIGDNIFGLSFPLAASPVSLYGMAFQYADKVFNDSRYVGELEFIADPASPIVGNYVQAVAGGAQPLPFLLYVPAGYGQCAGVAMPNVQETPDPKKLFSVEFGNGEAAW